MHGNVWEWCKDWFEEAMPSTQVVDPQGPEQGQFRVLRGGSWDYDGRYVRSAYRLHRSPSYWTFAIAYQGAAAQGSRGERGKRIDYREVLSEKDFSLYVKLRNLRKSLSEQEGVPAFQRWLLFGSGFLYIVNWFYIEIL